MSDLAPLDSFASSLVAALEAPARRALARQIASALRASQAKRIAAQQNPDGSAFEPRKPQLRPGGSPLGGRQRKGALRRAMFAKLRTAKYLKADASPDSAIVRFAHEVERIANVHQHGLRDRVNKRGLQADYPERRLLGFTSAEEALIADAVTAHLAERL